VTVNGEVFTIGRYQGLRLDLGGLLEILNGESPVALVEEDVKLAEAQLHDTLGASAASAPPAQQLRGRIGAGKYLAVGSLGRLGLTVVLGPMFHLVAAGTALSSVRRLLKFDRDWRPSVVAIYAQLEGLERDVFETIHEAQNEWIVVNYDAVEERRYSEAFGRVAPTAAEVARRLSSRANEGDLLSVLTDLLGRRILDTDGSRYWIRF
jgi:hypothetical protein